MLDASCPPWRKNKKAVPNFSERLSESSERGKSENRPRSSCGPESAQPRGRLEKSSVALGPSCSEPTLGCSGQPRWSSAEHPRGGFPRDPCHLCSPPPACPC